MAQTTVEAARNFCNAWHEFVLAVIYTLKLDRVVDWLSAKLQ